MTMMRISKSRYSLLLLLVLLVQFNLSGAEDDDNATLVALEEEEEDSLEEIGDYLNSIRDAIRLWTNDRPEAIKLHGPIEEWNLTGVTKMHSAFQDTIDFTADLSKWDVSGVTSMSGAFRNSTNFAAHGLNEWNTSGLLKLSWAFENSTNFSSDISRWDTSRVTSMYSMLEKSDAFSGGNFTRTWDTSRVVDFFRAFYNTSDWFHSTLCWDLSKARKGTSCNSLSLEFCEMMTHSDCPYTSCIAESAEIDVKSTTGEFQLAANFCAIEKEQLLAGSGGDGSGGGLLGGGGGGPPGVPAAHPEALEATSQFEEDNPQQASAGDNENAGTALQNTNSEASSASSSWKRRRSSTLGGAVFVTTLVLLSSLSLSSSPI